MNCQNVGQEKIALSPFEINEDMRQRYTLLHTPIKNEGISTNNIGELEEIASNDYPLDYFGNYFEASHDQSTGSDSEQIQIGEREMQLSQSESDGILCQDEEVIKTSSSPSEVKMSLDIEQSNVTEV